MRIPARIVSASALLLLACATWPAETPEAAQKFEFADVHSGQALPEGRFALTAGKKPNLKEADGSGDTGCLLRRHPAHFTGAGGVVTLNGQAVAAGPSMLVHYNCANVTLEAFAPALRTMVGLGAGASHVSDETGLAGKWNFDVRWSLGPNRNVEGETITASEAIRERSGLKLSRVRCRNRCWWWTA